VRQSRRIRSKVKETLEDFGLDSKSYAKGVFEVKPGKIYLG